MLICKRVKDLGCSTETRGDRNFSHGQRHGDLFGGDNRSLHRGPGVVIIKTSSGVTVGATVTYNNATRKVVINPNVTLARDTVYSVRVTIAATDRAGNKLDQNPDKSGNQAKSWKFRAAK